MAQVGVSPWVSAEAPGVEPPAVRCAVDASAEQAHGLSGSSIWLFWMLGKSEATTIFLPKWWLNGKPKFSMLQNRHKNHKHETNPRVFLNSTKVCFWQTKRSPSCGWTNYSNRPGAPQKKNMQKKKTMVSKRSEKYVAWKKLCLVGGFNPFEKY